MKSIFHIGIMVMIAVVATATQSELVGTWRSNNGKETTEFTADGHVRSLAGAVGIEGKYVCHSDVLVLKFEGDGAPPAIERKYKVNGDVLTLEDTKTHEIETYQRTSKGKG